MFGRGGFAKVGDDGIVGLAAGAGGSGGAGPGIGLGVGPGPGSWTQLPEVLFSALSVCGCSGSRSNKQVRESF